MTIDPKWLSEILKASGWQTTALSAAFGLFLILPRLGMLPPYDGWVKTLAVFGFVVCGCLAVANMLQALNEFFRPKAWLYHWIMQKRQRKWLRDYITHMTDEEKNILAYMLAKNWKTITTAHDGGYAATLISKGILLLSVRSDQTVSSDNVPSSIPSHLWDELQAHKDHFLTSRNGCGRARWNSIRGECIGWRVEAGIEQA